MRMPAEALRIDPATLQRLPESSRKVLDVIRDHAPASHADLRRLTGMPPRTIRYAVRRLKDEALIDSRHSLEDCRTCFFFIHPDRVRPDVVESWRRADTRPAYEWSVAAKR